MFPAFEILGRQVGTYGVCALVGFLAAGFAAALLGKKRGVSIDDIILLMLVAIGGLAVGGVFLYGVTHAGLVVKVFSKLPELSFKQFIQKMGYCFGGMVFYGGFIGAMTAVYIYSGKAKDIERKDALDIAAVSIPLFHGFGRIGCFLGGCCYGIESKFGFIAHGNELVPALNDVRRFPVQLVESACEFAIFFILLSLFKKPTKRSKILFYYLFIYPPIRFVLEFFRGDDIRGRLFGLTTSQWVSVILIVFAAVYVFVSSSKKREN